MLVQDLVLYQDRYAVRVNHETDELFYYFDYDTRNAVDNMRFQHFHPFYEVCVMLCPTSTHFWEGTPYTLQPLDIFCIPPNVLHKTQYPEGAPCRRLIIQFNFPRDVPGLSKEYELLLQTFRRGEPYRFDGEVQQKLFRKINDIYLLADKTDAVRNLSIHAKFVEFLTILYLNQERSIYTNRFQESEMEKKIYEIAGYIHSHYTEEISLEGLSQQFYISICYLSRQFKAVTGFTLTDYVQMTRVRNVQAMLINTNVPIAEAAGRCGFSSFSQFNRTFQKHIGMSPSAYRKRNKLPGLEAER